jgi:hypothetical protein
VGFHGGGIDSSGDAGAVLEDPMAALAVSAPAVAAVAPPERIDDKTVLSGGGSAMCASTRYSISNGADTLFGILDTRLEVVTLELAKSRQWVVVKVQSELSVNAVANLLYKHSVVGGVAQEGDRFLMLMKKNRSMSECLKMLPDAVIYSFVAVPSNTRSSQNEGIKMFRDFLKTGRDVVLNYIFIAVTEVDPMVSKEANLALIEKMKVHTNRLSNDAFETELMTAKMVKAADRDVEQACIVINHGSLQKCRKLYQQGLQAHAQMRRQALNVDLPIFNEMPTFMNLEVWGVNFNTWEVFRMGLGAFAKTGLASQYSVVLLGPPRSGKTPCSESLAAALAKGLQASGDDEMEDEVQEPYYLKVGTVESLKKLSEHLVSGVPLLFDDVTPAAKRGARQSKGHGRRSTLQGSPKKKHGPKGHIGPRRTAVHSAGVVQ